MGSALGLVEVVNSADSADSVLYGELVPHCTVQAQLLYGSTGFARHIKDCG